MFAFAKSSRLTKTDEYSSVFGFRRAIRGQALMLHYLPKEADVLGCRLGLVVGKKFLKTAVGRNTLKRMVRERFRQQQASLPPCDVIVRLIEKKKKVGRSEIAQEIDSLFRRLTKRLASGTPGSK